MFDALSDAIISYLQSQATTGGLLEGINQVQGPGDPLTQQMPVVQVVWDGVPDIVFNDRANGKIQAKLTTIIQVQLITQSLSALVSAQSDAMQLLLSNDLTTGLLVALGKKRGYQAGAQSFYTVPEKVQFLFGDAAARPYTFAAVIPLKAQTIVELG